MAPIVRFRTHQSKEKHKRIGDLAKICKIGMELPGSRRFPDCGDFDIIRAVGGLAILGLTLVVIISCGRSNPPRRNYSPPIHRDFYRVRPGDTLYSISRRSSHDFRTLARWNHIGPPYTIRVNQVLRLIPPKAKTVQTRRSQATDRHSSVTRKKKSKKSLKILWRWPLKGVIVRNYAQTGRKGIDIASTSGSHVRAAAAGKVVYSGSGLVGYGKLVIIKHGETYLSAYGNNHRLLVREGQKVRAGQMISELGKRAAKRPVLHFEIRRQGDPVDPLRFLPRHQ